jgi:hypothetical protein
MAPVMPVAENGISAKRSSGGWRRHADSPGPSAPTETVASPSRKDKAEALAFHQRLEATLKQQLTRIEGASLLRFHDAQRDESLPAPAAVRLPGNVEPDQVKHLEEALCQHVRPNASLLVRSVVGSDTASTGYLAGVDDAQFMRQMIDERHNR